MTSQSRIIYRYRIDNEDRMIGVNQWWLAFARENGAPTLTAANVVGRSIWDYIAGESTRSLYKQLNQYVRSTGNSVVVPFQCDSPTTWRQMQLTISRKPQASLLYEGELLYARPLRASRVSEGRGAVCLATCSCCKRSLLDPFGWLQLGDCTGSTAELIDPESLYTICPECAKLFHRSSSRVNAIVVGEQRN